jgi:arylsulfatase
MRSLSLRFTLATTAIFLVSPPVAMAKEIVHDAEYYILEQQHREQWDKEDKALDQELAAFRKKMTAGRLIFSTS